MTAATFRKKPVQVAAVRWAGDNEDELDEFAGHSFEAIDPDHPSDDDPEATASLLTSRHSSWALMYTGDWAVRMADGERQLVDPGAIEAAHQSGREAERQSGDCDCPAFVSLLIERDRAHRADREDAARAIESVFPTSTDTMRAFLARHRLSDTPSVGAVSVALLADARDVLTAARQVARNASDDRMWIFPIDAKADVVFADGQHRYWSTHCRHGNCAACSAAELAPGVPRRPAQCKTCAAPCLCLCHSGEER